MVNATQRKRIMSSPAMMMAIMNFMAFLICFLELPPVGEGVSPAGGLLSVCMGFYSVNVLFYVVNESEESAPSYSGESSVVRVARPPDEYWLAHDVVFRHESPVA